MFINRTRGSMLLCAVSSFAVIAPMTAFAQTESATSTVSDDQSANVQDIVVTGIRASQERAINVKREAASVVDAISAQDIGKLPDATISDSLQRIPGVQIRREAGEGGRINVRGLPQVTTLMNGESFLGAGSVTSVQPNFTDIPSQLFSGADVIKSPTASLLAAGITGTVDLKTRRPFDMKSGFTVAAAAEAAYGDKTEKWNPQFNGLLSWRNDDFGFLVSASYSDVDLSNSYSGIQRDYGGRLVTEAIDNATGYGGFRSGDATRGTSIYENGQLVGVDVNGDGDANDAFFSPQAHTGWERITSRERLGINASFQAHINDALELVADGFYTRQTQYDRTAGFQFQAVNWQAADFVPGLSRDTGSTINGFNFNTIQRYDYTLQNFDSYSDLSRGKSDSRNANIELRYDDGGPFKATLRGVYGKAKYSRDNSYLQFSLSDGDQWFDGVGHYPASLGGDRTFNALGYRYNTLPAVVDYTGSNVSFSLPNALTSNLTNPAAYALKTMSSENNLRSESDMKIVRFDGTYEFSPDFNAAFGARYGTRSAQETAFERAAPLYAGNGATDAAGCYVKWKAFDVQLNNTDSCAAGDGAGFYTAGLTRPATDSTLSQWVKQFNVPANGVGSILVLDPSAMDNPEKFQNSFYPGNERFLLPGRSYAIDLDQWSGYFQLNFQSEVAGMPLRGNGGVRVINTQFKVRQNISGPGQAYGLPQEDVGDVITKRSFTDFLPAFNLALDVTDDFRVRFAYAKTMTLLDLSQWGGGLDLTYAIDTTTNPPVFHVTGGNSNGNPQLDPWRAENLDLSFEYYLGRSSLLSLGLFKVNVASFIERSTVIRTDLADLDGVVRNAVPISSYVQGKGGTLKGLEAGAKVAFDFLPGVLSGFGFDANYTLSDSSSGRVDLSGAKEPFQDNSRHQINAALWFEKYGLQARVAWNYRSKRVEESNYAGIEGLTLYQKPTNYIDASISYDINDHVTIYAQGSNLTGEYEKYYLTFPDQKAFNNIYERRFLVGARTKF
ncbi:MAG: TonB-dependent receptor [Sphingobium sp.]|nr:MAG: TonB-dependent receptor [Sphingobium sp.]